MLMLSRREGQAITIQTELGDIELAVKKARHGAAKIGFSAPPGMNIVRNELLFGDPRPQSVQGPATQDGAGGNVGG